MCQRIIDMMFRFQIYLECTILSNGRRISCCFIVEASLQQTLLEEGESVRN